MALKPCCTFSVSESSTPRGSIIQILELWCVYECRKILRRVRLRTRLGTYFGSAVVKLCGHRRLPGLSRVRGGALRQYGLPCL